jgi:ammonium transporter, Amt family
VVWFAWTYLQPITLRKVDDASGVVYTHGLAGFTGGMLVGIFADPSIIVYTSSNGSPITVSGALYGHPKQLLIQFLAALTIIVWDALLTFIILKIISIFTSLRMPDDTLQMGDVEVHDEEAYPPEEGFVRTGELVGVGAPPGSAGSTAAPAPDSLAGETR